jgi:hypothetical protein
MNWSDISGPICGQKLFMGPPLADGSLVAGCVESSGLPVSPPLSVASILRSVDGGDSWQVVLNGILGGFNGGWFLTGTADGAGPLFAAPTVRVDGNLLRSDDFGATWEQVTEFENDRVLSILVDPEDPNTLLIGTSSSGVLRSFDGGESWQPWSDGLLSGQVFSLAMGQNMTEMFWAGTGAGAHVFKPIELCIPSPRSLCLEGRFRAEVIWEDFQGRTGEGIGVPFSSTTGTFWFFNQENVELVIKVLDGRGINGHHWLFWGGLSNVKYTLTVTDLLSGQQQIIENQIGSLASGGNIGAFPNFQDGGSMPTPARTLAGLPDPEPRPRSAKSDSPPLLLQNERFRIDVLWRTADGLSGMAEGLALTSESGTLWFFHPDNLEVFVKVLDGRPFNGHFWLFYAGLTNLEFNLTVVDTQTGASRSFHNPEGAFTSRVDIELF